MGFENSCDDPSVDVARIFRGDVCIGTGFLVSPDRVLTCSHVTDLDPDKLLRVRLAGGGFLSGIVEATSEAHDLALIRIPGQEARKPLCFLTGLKRSHEDTLRSLTWLAIGYDLRDSETFLSAASVGVDPKFQWDNKTETLLEVQVDLGLPNGFSGAPVLIGIPGTTLCIGIATQGGVDRPKTRIRLVDCIVGFLQGSGLDVESQDASEALEPKAISAALARQKQTTKDRAKQHRSWTWATAICLAAVAAFAGLYLFPKPKPNVIPKPEPTPNLVSKEPIPAPPKHVSLQPFYTVQIMMYSSATPPQLRINKKPATLEGYDGRTATLRLHPGIYQVDANYLDRICTARVSVTRDLSTEAECQLK